MRVKPLRKPAINRRQQFARLLPLALVAPEAREAHCGAEFLRFGILLARHGECAIEIVLCSCYIPHRLEDCGYVAVRNDSAKDGLWKMAGGRQVIYARSDLSVRDRIVAAKRLADELR
jgi:hypothetical protein